MDRLDPELASDCESKNGVINGLKREWHEAGSPRSEMEDLAEGVTQGKLWDDLGHIHEAYLHNGDPVSKRKFHQRLAKYLAGEEES